jgi:hypothetical protein
MTQTESRPLALGGYIGATEAQTLLGLGYWQTRAFGQSGIIRTRQLRPKGRLLYLLEDIEKILEGTSTPTPEAEPRPRRSRPLGVLKPKELGAVRLDLDAEDAVRVDRDQPLRPFGDEEGALAVEEADVGGVVDPPRSIRGPDRERPEMDRRPELEQFLDDVHGTTLTTI